MLDRTGFSEVDGWNDDRHREAFAAFRASCSAFDALPPTATIGKGELAEPASTWQDVCASAAETAPEDAQAKRFFEEYFTPFTVRGDGLFTGYYEPLMHGSRTRQGRFRFPVYALPDDVQSGEPYLTREEIDRGALKGKNLEIAWVDDEIALFFTHIQGSGRIRFENGEQIRIGYAGKNNRAYVALGKVLKDNGELPPESVNFYTIRDWLRDNPNRAQAMMWENPSYVFFRELPADGSGPPGAQGVPLVAGRSLAVDARFLPYGIPLFLHTETPETPYARAMPLRRLMVAQDTGGAIKGPVRGDVFFGAGEEAEANAGLMKARGRYVLLVPNALASRL